MKKYIVYIIVFIYIAIPVVLFIFKFGDGIPSINPEIDFALIILLIPVSFIIFMFGLFGGQTGAIIGTLLTICIAILIIERYFKKHPSEKKD